MKSDTSTVCNASLPGWSFRLAPPACRYKDSGVLRLQRRNCPQCGRSKGTARTAANPYRTLNLSSSPDGNVDACTCMHACRRNAIVFALGAGRRAHIWSRGPAQRGRLSCLTAHIRTRKTMGVFNECSSGAGSTSRHARLSTLVPEHACVRRRLCSNPKQTGAVCGGLRL